MRLSFAVLPLAALTMIVPAVGASAQTTLDGRVSRLEQEMRAVQRKVFPEGAGRTLQPELTPPPSPGVVPGTPASSPVADLEARLSAVEAQVRTLTGQVEQGNYRLRQLEEAFAKYKADADARLAGPVAATATPAPATPPTAPAAAAAPAKPAATTPNDTRKAAVAAIERPSTGDAANDAYTYGFRLWSAKFYPEAQEQLRATVEKYGTSVVASRAHNLLGRAYLDDGKPALASVAFYENYQKRPKGDRAADSLAYLGDALIQLKKPADACKVYQELNEVYGDGLRAELKDLVAKGRARAKCSA